MPSVSLSLAHSSSYLQNHKDEAMFEGLYPGSPMHSHDRAVMKHIERLVIKRQQSRETQRRLIRSRTRRNSNTTMPHQKNRRIQRLRDGLIMYHPLSRYSEPYNNGDKLSTVKSKRYFPEDTYEHWHLEKELNKNVQRHANIDVSKKRKIKTVKNDISGTTLPLVFSSSEDEYANSDDEGIHQTDQEQEEEDEDEDDTSITDKIIEERVRLQTTFIDKISTRVIVEKSGYEVLPYTPPSTMHIDRPISFLSKSKSYTERHSDLLHDLLHLCVLRKKWELGYKVFSTLIRLPHIDVRGIWPQGLEILTRLAEKKYTDDNPGVSDYTLRVFGSNTESAMRMAKDEEFLQWIASFYPIFLSRHNVKSSKPFPFRKGSKLTAPVFVVTLIWTLLYKQKFDLANEKLSDLLLMTPYINDGVFHFIQGLSFQMEAAYLVQKDIFDKTRVEKLISDANKFYQQAKVLGAVFPEKLIKVELDLIKTNLEEPESYSSSANDKHLKTEMVDEFGFDGEDEDGFNRLKNFYNEKDEGNYDSDD